MIIIIILIITKEIKTKTILDLTAICATRCVRVNRQDSFNQSESLKYCYPQRLKPLHHKLSINTIFCTSGHQLLISAINMIKDVMFLEFITTYLVAGIYLHERFRTIGIEHTYIN